MAGIKSTHIEPFCRARLVTRSADVSYRKSVALTTPARLSGQSVLQSIRKLGTIPNQAAVMPAAKPGIHKVYVEADEDHVAMQKGHAKKMKLIKFFIFRMLFYNWFQRCKYFFYSLDKFWFMSILFLYPCEDRCYRGHGLLSFEAVQAALGHRNQLL